MQIAENLLWSLAALNMQTGCLCSRIWFVALQLKPNVNPEGLQQLGSKSPKPGGSASSVFAHSGQSVLVEHLSYAGTVFLSFGHLQHLQHLQCSRCSRSSAVSLRVWTQVRHEQPVAYDGDSRPPWRRGSAVPVLRKGLLSVTPWVVTILDQMLDVSVTYGMVNTFVGNARLCISRTMPVLICKLKVILVQGWCFFHKLCIMTIHSQLDLDDLRIS